MNVSGIQSGNAQNISSAMPSKGTDPVSQSIQKQIADAQKQLQEISADDRLSVEDKMKKRQEIQQGRQTDIRPENSADCNNMPRRRFLSLSAAP